MLKYFSGVSEGAGEPDALNVPVCASYCEAWFIACKNDKTCAFNGMTGKT